MSDEPLLSPELMQARQQASARRRAFVKAPEGSFAREGQDAIEAYLRMRAEGVSQDDAVKGLELVLRDSYPTARELPWRHYCDICQDSGALIRWCRGGTGERLVTPTFAFEALEIACDRKWPHGAHSYFQPCDCPKGDKYRPKEPASDDEALTKIGQMTRVGRKR